jgi:hypothetical protein
MSLVMTLGVVLAVFCFDAAVAQEGWVTTMTSGTAAFTKRSNAPMPKARAAILPIVVPPQGDRSMATTR